MQIRLPYPPSTNRYYRVVEGRVLISKDGRAYRQKICSIIHSLKLETAKKSIELEMVIHAHPPDRRQRDVDNLQKPLLDALEKAFLFENDSQIKKLTTEMLEPCKGGMILVTIEERKKN